MKTELNNNENITYQGMLGTTKVLEPKMLTLGGTKKVGKEQKDKITPKKVEGGEKTQKLLE